MIILIFATLFSWVYMRLVVFPFCLIINAYEPGPTDPWNVVYYPLKLLKYKLIVLVGMHMFWIFHLVRSVLFSFKKKSFGNHHETGEEKSKPEVSN